MIIWEGHELAHPWGLQFLADPDSSLSDEVFWRPEAAPAHVVRLQPAGGASGVEITLAVAAYRWCTDGVHLKLRSGLQIFVAEGDFTGPLAAVLPISGSFSATLRAVQALERSLRGEPPTSDLTAQQQARLTRSLAAYDAAEAQCTYREIARCMFGNEAIDRYAWRTSSVRDTVIRLVRTGRALVDGGYLGLLSGRASQPGGWPGP